MKTETLILIDAIQSILILIGSVWLFLTIPKIPPDIVLLVLFCGLARSVIFLLSFLSEDKADFREQNNSLERFGCGCQCPNCSDEGYMPIKIEDD